MDIIFVMEGYVWVPGGSHRVVYEYANQLVRRGHKVTLLFPRQLTRYQRTGGLKDWLKRQVLRASRWLTKPRPGWFDLDDRVQTISIAEPIDAAVPGADAIVATSWAVAEYVVEYAPEKGKKVYLIHHPEGASGHPTDRVDATWRMPFDKIVVSRWTGEQVKNLGINGVRYVPNGLDHGKYRIMTPIESRTPHIAMSYVPKKIKDPASALKAMTLVKEAKPDLKVTFFGSVRPPADLPPWITYERGRSDEFIVDQIYNRASIYLCSSIVEGFGLPVAEAMACGCAVVSTDCGGIRDFAEHDVTALLSPPGQPEALAANLRRLLDDDALRVRLASQGHERIQGFSWSRSTDLLEEVLRR